MVSFLFRNLKGYRFLVVLTFAVTFAQVGADLLLALSYLSTSQIMYSFPSHPAKSPPAS